MPILRADPAYRAWLESGGPSRPRKPATRGTVRLAWLTAGFAGLAFVTALLTNVNIYACGTVFVVAFIVIFYGWTQEWYLDQSRPSGARRRRKERKERRRLEREERERRARENGPKGLTVKDIEAKELK